MNNDHWQDWINALIGVWVIISPWTVAHVMAAAQYPLGAPESAMWNQFAVGAAMVGVASLALNVYAGWEEWINALLGAWLVVSPWALGFDPSSDLGLNAALLGTMILVFSVWALVDDLRAKRVPGRGR